MWPFKKKRKQKNSPIEVNTIICVPGYWKDKGEIFSGSNGELMIVGNFLIDVKNDRHYIVELCERDERMMLAFAASSFGSVTQDFLNEVNRHSSVLYITGKTGNIKECRLIAETIKKLLDSGGIGVKIETAGKAFDKDKWISLAETFVDSDVYKLFVLDSLVNIDGTVYSCGMHNLGLKDTIVSGLRLDEAIAMVEQFNYYQVIDKPVILNGQTFSSSAESSLFRIADELNQVYKGQELFENPYGMWRLTKE